MAKKSTVAVVEAVEAACDVDAAHRQIAAAVKLNSAASLSYVAGIVLPATAWVQLPPLKFAAMALTETVTVLPNCGRALRLKGNPLTATLAVMRPMKL